MKATYNGFNIMYRLTEIEKQFIRDNYTIYCPRIIAEKLNKSKTCIQRFLIRENLEYNHRKLSSQQEKLLIDNYSIDNINWIAKTIGKTRRSVLYWAKQYGLYHKSPSGDLGFLFTNALEAYYWLGFIAADGCLMPDGAFTISQHYKDKDRIELLAVKLKAKVREYVVKNSYTSLKTTAYTISINQLSNVLKLREMFKLTNIQKTKAGISLDFIQSKEQAQAFFLGFIDGDGYIHYDAGKIQCYHTWVSVFKKLQSLLPINFHNEKIYLQFIPSKNKSFATWNLRITNLRILKKFALDNNLPISQRKWSKVNEKKLH